MKRELEKKQVTTPKAEKKQTLKGDEKQDSEPKSVPQSTEQFTGRHNLRDTNVAYLIVAHAPVVESLATQLIKGHTKDEEKAVQLAFCSSFELLIGEESEGPSLLKEINDDYIESRDEIDQTITDLYCGRLN